MERVFFHIDVNSAFLSWSALERLENGGTDDLRAIPSVVGGDEESRHGIVLAKSSSAKSFGIVTGEPLAQARRKCPGLVIVSPNFENYKRRSRQFIDYLNSIAGEVEQASIDECYVNYHSIDPRFRLKDPVEMADSIRTYIKEHFGFTVNVGISDRKVLAKMASDFRKPDRTHTLWHREIEQKMWPLPVSDLFMCGKSAVETLRKLGILTIGDLAGADYNVLLSHMKSHGKLLWEFANGIDESGIQLEAPEAKGIGNSSTFSQDLLTLDEISHELLKLCDRVTARAREGHFLIAGVTVEIRYSNFTNVSHQQILPMPTTSSTELHNTVRELARAIWNGTPVRLLGVRAGRLLPEDEPFQLTLDDFLAGGKKEAARQKNRQLEEALDQIRSKYGQDAVQRLVDTMSQKPPSPK